MSAMKALWQSHRDTYEESMLDALECVRRGWIEEAQSHVWVAVQAANSLGSIGNARRLRQVAWRVQNWLRSAPIPNSEEWCRRRGIAF